MANGLAQPKTIDQLRKSFVFASIFVLVSFFMLHLGNFNHSFQTNKPVVHPAHVCINTIYLVNKGG